MDPTSISHSNLRSRESLLIDRRENRESDLDESKFQESCADSNNSDPPGVSSLMGVDVGSLPLSEIQSIAIVNPEKRGSGISTYIIYTIITKHADQGENSSVERRFNDFVWLRESLRRSNRGIIVPPLPHKNMAMGFALKNWGLKSTLRRFPVDFIKKRQRGLQRFLTQVVGHNMLRTNKATLIFLSAAKADIKIAKVSKQITKEIKAAEPVSTAESISAWGEFFRQVAVNSIPESLGFGKKRVRSQQDIQIESLGELNRKSTAALTKLLEAMAELEKRQTQMSQSWLNMGVAAQSFSKLTEENLKLNHDSEGSLCAMFGRLARGAERLSNVTIRKVQEDSLKLYEPLQGLKQTGVAVEGILKDRNKAQQEVESARNNLVHRRKRRMNNERYSDFKSAIQAAEGQQQKAKRDLKEITTRITCEYHRYTAEKVDKLKHVLRNFVEREVQFQEHTLTEFRKLQQDLAGNYM
jgi:hypothetical protein